jgi:hypothetical protein
VRKFLLLSVIVVVGCNQYDGDKSSIGDETPKTKPASGIVYSNPRVYNVDYSFEMVPDPNNIDRAKDLKVWIPIPREWDSQKAVKIISVQPEPHARYVDPEYGNPMLFWDFGKMPEQPSYKVDIKFRLESYDVSVKVDPNVVGSYDMTSKEYAVYTQSTHTISITPKIRELAQVAIGDEKNPYLQAKRIVEFASKKVHFKLTAFERGRGIKCLLDYPVRDEKTGEEYYEGACNQITALFVALCRAVGIPARCVSGYVGWNPLVTPNDVKATYPFETKLSPEGLAATQLYGGLGSHMWGEFFIPNYGWIPTDPQSGTIGHQNNRWWIKYKGRDIQLGPHTPKEDGEGYGVNWVALQKGRADSLCYGALNIAKIRNSKVTILHHSDPFPAEGLASYNQNPPSANALPTEKDILRWRQDYRRRVLSMPSRIMGYFIPDSFTLSQLYDAHSYAAYTKADIDGFICDMLRSQLGDEQFEKLSDKYIELRQKSKQAVPTSRFQEVAEEIHQKPLGWFFSQWVNNNELPRLTLEKVVLIKKEKGWQINGHLLQPDKKTFRLPIELAIDTKNNREVRSIWMDDKVLDFDFTTLSKPEKLVVDPEYKILKLQKMPPHLSWFWNSYPDYLVVYGTLEEAEINKVAAERFNSDELGLDREIVKADTDVNETDLSTKCVFLIGRPEANKVAQRFKDSFPIRFDGARFTWQGTTYDKPTQRLHQIIENPNNTQGLIIMYAGLSQEATLRMCDLESYDSDCSYVVFDGDKQLLTGDWEDADDNLYRNFDTH